MAHERCTMAHDGASWCKMVQKWAAMGTMVRDSAPQIRCMLKHARCRFLQHNRLRLSMSYPPPKSCLFSPLLPLTYDFRLATLDCPSTNGRRQTKRPRFSGESFPDPRFQPGIGENSARRFSFSGFRWQIKDKTCPLKTTRCWGRRRNNGVRDRSGLRRPKFTRLWRGQRPRAKGEAAPRVLLSSAVPGA